MLSHSHPTGVPPTRVVILGSAGFVGQAVARQLRAEGIPLLELPRSDLDLTDPGSSKTLAGLFRANDVLLFISARAPVKDNDMLVDNVLMARTVCDALQESPVDQVVYMSSDAVYADSDTPLTESSCAQPESLHGVMHLTREVMLSNAWSGPLAFLRSTLIYGVDDPHNGYGPNRFLRSARDEGEILLFGEGEERRDHVSVEDVASLLRLIAYHRSSGVLNAATGQVVSFGDAARAVADLVQRDVKIKSLPRSGPMPHRGYRPFDPACTGKAFPDFSYTPFATGIERMASASTR